MKSRRYRLYEVSSLGRLRSRETQMVLEGSPEPNGTLSVQIIALAYGGRVHEKTSIARLVLSTFVRFPQPGEIVGYADGNPNNTRPRNLRWTTKEKAAARAKKRGVATAWKRLTQRQVEQLRALKGRMSCAEAGLRFGVGKAAVSKVWRGETHAGR